MDLDEKVTVLEKSTIFSSVNGKTLIIIAKFAEELSYSDGDVIFNEGEWGNCFYIIARGQLKILHRNATLAILSPLETVGEMSIIDDMPRSADAIAYGDTLLLRFTRQGYLEIISRFPQISLEISKLLANRIRKDNQKLFEQYQEIQNRKLLERELEIAQEIQRKLLPQKIPSVPNLEIVAKCLSAKKVGGDFYEFIRFRSGNKNQIGVITGDVSGKGLSAAIIMANSKGTLTSEAFDHVSPAETLSEANQWLYKDTPSNMFLAIFYGLIDSEKMQMIYSCAGQPLPLVLRKGQQSPFFISPNQCRIPLGAFKKNTYDEKCFPLEEGDLLVFCSDGVLEAHNQRDEMWSFDGLEKAVSQCKGLSAQKSLEKILDQLTNFTKNAEIYDDYTLVIIKITEKTG